LVNGNRYQRYRKCVEYNITGFVVDFWEICTMV